MSIVPPSAFNTDYVLIRADQQAKALEALRQGGHKVENAAKPALQISCLISAPPGSAMGHNLPAAVTGRAFSIGSNPEAF
jgi:hypothetical protein